MPLHTWLFWFESTINWHLHHVGATARGKRKGKDNFYSNYHHHMFPYGASPAKTHESAPEQREEKKWDKKSRGKEGGGGKGWLPE